MSLELTFLPAQEGDAIWIEWPGDHGSRHQMLVDMGQGVTGRRIRERVAALDEGDRHFELLVVTHVDADHIGGVITGLADEPALAGWTFGDIWFNGYVHLGGRRAPEEGLLEAQGPAQGEVLSKWLSGRPWNQAFDRYPVQRRQPLDSVDLPGGMRLTVIGPPSARLKEFRPTWAEEVNEAVDKARLPESDRKDVQGLEAMGLKPKPTKPLLTSWEDLAGLAAEDPGADTAPANGSSICLVLEWGQRRVLLTGDAWSPDVLTGINELGLETPAVFDLVKMAHHGSSANVSAALLDAISCEQWVISTNGAKYYHPGAPAIARLLREDRRPRPHLLFNVRSEFNEWWMPPLDALTPDWPTMFKYEAHTGTNEDGFTVALEPG